MMWELPASVEIQGTVYKIRTDFRCILDICAAVADPELNQQDKSEAALLIFYPDFGSMPYESWEEAIEKCFWFLNGGDPTDGRKAPRLVDWEQDFSLLVPPVNRVLGQEVRSMEYLHWWTFLGAYQEIGDCTFAQVVRIRDHIARGKKMEKQDQEWYRHNRHLVDFKNRYTAADTDTMREWSGGSYFGERG